MQPKRRWYQFSLRTLVVVMLLVSLVLGYWGYARRRAQRQWEAVRAIREAGGSVRFKDLGIVDPYEYDSSTESPTWQKRLGIEYPPTIVEVNVSLPNGSGKEIMPHMRQLHELESIRLHGDGVDDECLKALSSFPSLNNLFIKSDQITDAGVLSLARNKQLHELHLLGKQPTDRGLAVVAQLPELRNLFWESGNATGEGLAHLRNHPQLSTLVISGAMASDTGFEHLSACANLDELVVDAPNTLTRRGIGALARLQLKHLVFIESPLSKNAVAALSDMTTLESLQLTGPLSAEDLAHLAPLVSMTHLTCFDFKLTGEGLKKLTPLQLLEDLRVDMAYLDDEDMDLLASFSELRHVDLSNSAVTDAGLMKLVGMKQLSGLTIDGTKVTAEGVKEFERLAPDVMVEGKYGQPAN